MLTVNNTGIFTNSADLFQLSPGKLESTRLSQAPNDAAHVDVGHVSMDTATSV